MQTNFNIEQFLDLTGYEESRADRRKGSGGTQEFFTPYSIVKKMCDKVSDEDWADPDKTFCEPCFGNGQFVIYILYRRIHEYNIPWRRALETMFGVELMSDNVRETRQRIHELLRNIAPDYDSRIADKIMRKNLVCSDFFKWDFEHWRPLEEKHKQLIFNFK